MPPKKEKAEKSTAEEGSALVLDYLKKQNRPYSAIEISANLHNKVTKTQAVKILKELHERNLIAGKTAGKQSIYHAIQDAKDTITPEELATMNGAIESLKEDITSAKNEEKALKARLATLGTVMSMEDLQKNIQSLESEREELLSRLAPLRAGTAKPISAQEKETVDRDWKMWSSRAKTRKKICLELWNMLTEELPEGKTKEELWEELGLEDDN